MADPPANPPPRRTASPDAERWSYTDWLLHPHEQVDRVAHRRRGSAPVHLFEIEIDRCVSSPPVAELGLTLITGGRRERRPL